MEIAQAEATSEFAGLSASRSASSLREVDLNETPSTQNKRLRSRVEALMKTGILFLSLKDPLFSFFYCLLKFILILGSEVRSIFS